MSPMLSMKDMLNPLPVAEHAAKLDLPVSPLTNHHVAPDTDGLIVDDHEASPSPTQTHTRACSSPPLSHLHSTPHHAHILSPLRESLESPPQSLTSSPLANLQHTAEYNVSLNRKTTLKTLYHYPLGVIVEYPESSSEGCIGHLFDISPDDWLNPRSNFVYA